MVNTLIEVSVAESETVIDTILSAISDIEARISAIEEVLDDK